MYLKMPENLDSISAKEAKDLVEKIDKELDSLREKFANDDVMNEMSLAEVKANNVAIAEMTKVKKQVLSILDKIETELKLKENEKVIEKLEAELKAKTESKQEDGQEDDEESKEEAKKADTEDAKKSEDDKTVAEKVGQIVNEDTKSDIPLDAGVQSNAVAASYNAIPSVKKLIEDFRTDLSITGGTSKGIVNSVDSLNIGRLPQLSHKNSSEKNLEIIMSYNSPNSKGPDSLQKSFFSAKAGGNAKVASFCNPPQRLEEEVVCSTYDPSVINMFRNFQSDSLHMEYDVLSDDPSDFVGLVDLDADPIDKSDICGEKLCDTQATLAMKEFAACLLVNEQTFLTLKDGRLQQLINRINGEMLAQADSLILDEIDNKSSSYVANPSVGLEELPLIVGSILDQLTTASIEAAQDGYELLVPRSLMWYLRGSNRLRAYTNVSSQNVADEYFQGLPVSVFNDVIDSGASLIAPPPVGGGTATVTYRPSWTVRLLRPSDGFVTTHAVNEWTLRSIPQSIDEHLQNMLPFFARAYINLGKVVPCNWATVEILNPCAGNSVAPAGTCVI